MVHRFPSTNWSGMASLEEEHKKPPNEEVLNPLKKSEFDRELQRENEKRNVTTRNGRNARDGRRMSSETKRSVRRKWPKTS